MKRRDRQYDRSLVEEVTCVQRLAETLSKLFPASESEFIHRVLSVFSLCSCPHVVLLFFPRLQHHQRVRVASEGRAQAVPHEGAHPVTHG